MTVIDYLYHSAELFPEKTAFEDSQKSVTYRELLSNAETICTQLRQVAPVVKSPIAVLIDRNVESICCFLGIAMGRNFYVPIDITQPEERIGTILRKVSPAAVISLGNCKESFLPYIEEIKAPLLEYSELLKGEKDPGLVRQLQEEALDTDPLYALSTSGSTGIPKTVLISHRSVLDFIPVFCGTFHFDSNEIFGNQAPFDFDVSVKDIYSALYLGATVYIIPAVCFIMPKLLIQTMNDKRISTIIWAVSAMCIVSELNIFELITPTTLKKVFFSGEVMPVSMLNVWIKYLPDAMYVNLYGPTEITCNCLYYIIDRSFDPDERLPLGKPFKNEGVFFLNDNGQPIKPGETGEIYVTGTCLSLGYYKDPEKTKEVFIQNPLNPDFPELAYKSGDMAELGEDGNYYFSARRDFQIKHMGHRIELEDIEMHLNSLPSVTRAVCLYDEPRKKLITFYIGTEDYISVLNQLKKLVPKYMIPNIVFQQDTLPRNKNGKIDRKALFAIYEKSL
ncbi:MAG: amino acid adenylation domain-containing protein [Parasporobacterium sp.]|nr:amino acid adenylation domain-containing protein [Parasporobacterium sp.]